MQEEFEFVRLVGDERRIIYEEFLISLFHAAGNERNLLRRPCVLSDSQTRAEEASR